jgi:hypothetical protein
MAGRTTSKGNNIHWLRRVNQHLLFERPLYTNNGTRSISFTHSHIKMNIPKKNINCQYFFYQQPKVPFELRQKLHIFRSFDSTSYFSIFITSSYNITHSDEFAPISSNARRVLHIGSRNRSNDIRQDLEKDNTEQNPFQQTTTLSTDDDDNEINNNKKNNDLNSPDSRLVKQVADISFNDNNNNSWIERFLPQSYRPYAYLARLDKPIGTMLLVRC